MMFWHPLNGFSNFKVSERSFWYHRIHSSYQKIKHSRFWQGCFLPMFKSAACYQNNVMYFYFLIYVSCIEKCVHFERCYVGHPTFDIKTDAHNNSWHHENSGTTINCQELDYYLNILRLWIKRYSSFYIKLLMINCIQYF